MPSRILTWHQNEMRSLAIADFIWYSDGQGFFVTAPPVPFFQVKKEIICNVYY